MWVKIGENHWRHGAFGIYEHSGWWRWYRTQSRKVKRGNFTVDVECEVQHSGPWPTKEQCVAEMAGRGLEQVDRRTA